MIASEMVNLSCNARKESTLSLPMQQVPELPIREDIREDFSEYVAHLQLHMALQARNLVPPVLQVSNSRDELLHQTQANFEKLISRQSA